ncbi:MAG: hypothetical protein JNK04_16295 [Myxococcales bacterium]|nr:hypothetical protein [Myxococcales bacterium]
MKGYPAAFALRFEFPLRAELELAAAALCRRIGDAYGTPIARNGLTFGKRGQGAAIAVAPGLQLLVRQSDPDCWTAELIAFVGKVTIAELPECLRRFREVAAAEVKHGEVDAVELIRMGDDADGYPQVPLLRKRHLFAAKVTLDEDYEDVGACRTCPGVDFETTADYLFVTRGLTAISDADFLRTSLQQCWHFARAAKPGVVTYGELPHEKHVDIYRAAPSRLRPVGYADGLAEYACYLEREEHIAGWEIDDLQRMLKEGRFSDGRPLYTLRVAFPNREQAVREKRPLLDCGIKVVFTERGSEYELCT